MSYRTSLLILVFSILISDISLSAAFANENVKPRPYEEIYPEIGYKSVEEAKREFEQHFKKTLKLPLRVPPIEFTHYVGRFSDLEGELNDSFEVEFISDQSPKNHYKINVRPIKHKIPIRDDNVLRLYKLKNGNEAVYTNISGFNVLVFERGSWQYMLSINKKVSDKVSPEILVQIANSIDYSTEIKN
ncbi:hypothetical protein [Alkalihalobacillus sp. AL-G]|uniref:hypothetical protein n=1 Tax=Alkalihalobacillus sp. AL-G TaxID=2926399 RepID=UPI00272B8648|nr:hypothetical protein [Alkalihalobacillus sp. AL-G]WLD94639.1 hypothetical protein MOJ78_07080 [Alkalihalobacillus sp. AL-G]